MTTHIGDNDFLEFNQEADDHMEEMKGTVYGDIHMDIYHLNHTIMVWVRLNIIIENGLECFILANHIENLNLNLKVKISMKKFSEYDITTLHEYINYDSTILDLCWRFEFILSSYQTSDHIGLYKDFIRSERAIYLHNNKAWQLREGAKEFVIEHFYVGIGDEVLSYLWNWLKQGLNQSNSLSQR